MPRAWRGGGLCNRRGEGGEEGLAAGRMMGSSGGGAVEMPAAANAARAGEAALGEHGASPSSGQEGGTSHAGKPRGARVCVCGNGWIGVGCCRGARAGASHMDVLRAACQARCICHVQSAVRGQPRPPCGCGRYVTCACMYRVHACVLGCRPPRIVAKPVVRANMLPGHRQIWAMMKASRRCSSVFPARDVRVSSSRETLKKAR